MPSSSITGAILAGGPNIGLSGTIKPLLPFEGESLIEHQIKIMRQLCQEIIVVTNTPKPFFRVLDDSVRLITDYFAGSGPLGGIHAALQLARHPLVWIAGCEMPFLSADTARLLADSRTAAGQAAIPIVHGEPFPLHGLYAKENKDAAAQLLAAGIKDMRSFLNKIPWLGVSAGPWTMGPSPENFTYAIRTQQDYEQARAALGYGTSAFGTPTTEWRRSHDLSSHSGCV